jgi:ParB-like chromosome segregation protein Spo0J
MVVRTDDLTRKPKEWLKPPRQRRSRYDEKRIKELAESIRTLGLMNPPECLADGEIISGENRRQAIMLIEEITEVPVRIVDVPEAIDIRIRRIAENLQRVDWSLEDKLAEVEGFKEEQPGITNQEIAMLVKVHPSSITRIEALKRCVPEVRAVADEIGVAAMYDLSKLPPEEQAEALAVMLAARAARKAKKEGNGTGMMQATAEAGDAPTASAGADMPKTGKPKGSDAAEVQPSLTIALPGGMAVVVIGARSAAEASPLLARAGELAEDGRMIEPEKFEDHCRKLADVADTEAAINDARAAARKAKGAKSPKPVNDKPVAAVAAV